ncbi:flagellar motor switch protein FliM [Kineosporia sp. R_H_3]|uniref:flagellar motor switch protein FliM n=1 Tax=Kineosporia sp. R_H_3 TaxID=1961848 RepID=UPI00130461E1|nr:flagellar motor switch protein FliM [Kineosporia sp. R_H_3]
MTRPRRGEARTYDFRRPVRLAREHSHMLRVAMQTWSRQATTLLTTSLRVVCQLSNAQIEELSYDEFLTGMPDQSVCAVVTLDPLPGKALISLDLPAVLTMIDHQLGGPGGPDQPDRPLTDIEQSITKTLLTRLLRELTYAFETIAHVEPHLIAIESDARFVQAALPTDPVVVARLDLVIGQLESSVEFCLPFAMLAPSLEAMTRSQESGDKTRVRLEAAERTQQRLSDVQVDVRVRFEPVRLPSEQVGRIAVGDVIALHHPATRPLSVTSAATEFARAVPGASGRKLAVLITDALAEKP